MIKAAKVGCMENHITRTNGSFIAIMKETLKDT